MSEYQFSALLANIAIGSIPGIALMIYSIKEGLLPLGIVGWLASVSVGTGCAMILGSPVGLPAIITATIFYGIIKYSKKSN